MRHTGEHTQLAAIGERLAALATFVRFLAPMAPLMPLQRRLSRKHLSTDRAFEVFICAVSEVSTIVE